MCIMVGSGREQTIAGRQRSKKRPVLFAILLFLFLAAPACSVFGYLVYNAYTARYHTDLSLAQAGIQHLQKAETLLVAWPQHLFDAQFAGQAEQEFASAFKAFGPLQSDLSSLPPYAGQVPVYGARLSTAQHLVPLAITLSQAGIAGSGILKLLVSALHDPLTSQGPGSRGITPSDIVIVAQHLKELHSALESASRQINQLQPADIQFDPRISKLVDIFHKYAPLMLSASNGSRGWLDTFEQLLGVGMPASYLVEVLDSTELRPGGGFIGNYGIVTLAGGRLAAAHITDVDLLDKPYEMAGNTIAYPPAYTWFGLAPSSWSFRDSNLDADFPTAARYGEQTYWKEGGTVPVQGVIAITPALIERAMVITGPIAVPEYHETVTAENVVARIHYHQLGGSAAGEGSDLIPAPDGHSSLRKRFTELLAEHLLARVRQLQAADLFKFLQVMASAVRSKDLQLYFNSGKAEDLLHGFQLDAAIQSPVGDSLFVVDANIAPNKANSFIVNTLNDQVTIDSEGNAIHHATLSYAWTIPGRNYGSALYRDYVRIYVPPNSSLQAQAGWEPRGTGMAFGREVWSGIFTLSYGQTHTITLTWKVPGAGARLIAPAANHNQSTWHYQYLIQRQAGALWKLNLQLTLPACASADKMLGGLIAHTAQDEKLAQSLGEDLHVGVDYAC